MIKLSGKYQTRDGRKAKIYSTEAGGMYPVHGAVLEDGGAWSPRSWKSDGTYGTPPGKEDLVEVPKTVKKWLNVYPDGVGVEYLERQSCDNGGTSNRIGVLRIEITGDNYEVYKEALGWLNK